MELLLDCRETRLYQHQVDAVPKESGAHVQSMPGFLNGVNRQTPMLAGQPRGLRDGPNCVADLLMFILSSDAAQNGEVAGAQKDYIHTLKRGDRLGVGDSAWILNLNGDERFFVGR